MKEKGKSAKTVFVKLQWEDKPRKIPATHAVEQFGGSGLVVYNDAEVVARFSHGLENWWTEEA